MLFQRCFANVETTSINVRRLNFHFQPNINVETTLMNVDDQRCFNVDSTLMCLLGYITGRLRRDRKHNLKVVTSKKLKTGKTFERYHNIQMQR